MKTYKITIITASAARVEIKGQYASSAAVWSAIQDLLPDAKRVSVIQVAA
jgi:hypothetical protein